MSAGRVGYRTNEVVCRHEFLYFTFSIVTADITKYNHATITAMLFGAVPACLLCVTLIFAPEGDMLRLSMREDNI